MIFFIFVHSIGDGREMRMSMDSLVTLAVFANFSDDFVPAYADVTMYAGALQQHSHHSLSIRLLR